MKFVPFGGNLKYLTKTLAEHPLRGRLLVLATNVPALLPSGFQVTGGLSQEGIGPGMGDSVYLGLVGAQ